MPSLTLDDFSIPFLLLALLCLGLLLTQLMAFALPTSATPRPKQKRPLCPLKPRTLDDCPDCLLPAALPTSPFFGPIKPWSRIKGKRGRQKTIPTERYACANRHCIYYGITDSTLHALVTNGHIGINLNIQAFRCQACGRKFSARRHTVLSHLKTSPKSVCISILSPLTSEPGSIT